MKQHTEPITGRIVVTHQAPSGVVAKVNGKATLFRNREALFRAAVLLAERRPIVCQAPRFDTRGRSSGQ
jgi:hypothetical protein